MGSWSTLSVTFLGLEVFCKCYVVILDHHHEGKSGHFELHHASNRWHDKNDIAEGGHRFVSCSCLFWFNSWRSSWLAFRGSLAFIGNFKLCAGTVNKRIAIWMPEWRLGWYWWPTIAYKNSNQFLLILGVKTCETHESRHWEVNTTGPRKIIARKQRKTSQVFTLR